MIRVKLRRHAAGEDKAMPRMSLEAHAKLAPLYALTRPIISRFLPALVCCLACLMLSGCATTLLDAPRPVSHAIDNPAQTSLGRAMADQLMLLPGQSGFQLIVSGRDAFVTRAALARAAERTLDLQYYIVAQDATATQLL